MRKFVSTLSLILLFVSCAKVSTDNINGYWIAEVEVGDEDYSEIVKFPLYIENEEVFFYSNMNSKVSQKIEKLESQNEIIYKNLSNSKDAFFEQIVYNKKEKTTELILNTSEMEGGYIISGMMVKTDKAGLEKAITENFETKLKSNMHSIQVAVELMALETGGDYNLNENDILINLPENFANPYSPSLKSFIVSGSKPKWSKELIGTTYVYLHYTDESEDGYLVYSIYGFGENGILDLVLTPGIGSGE